MADFRSWVGVSNTRVASFALIFVLLANGFVGNAQDSATAEDAATENQVELDMVESNQDADTPAEPSQDELNLSPDGESDTTPGDEPVDSPVEEQGDKRSPGMEVSEPYDEETNPGELQPESNPADTESIPMESEPPDIGPARIDLFTIEPSAVNLQPGESQPFTIQLSGFYLFGSIDTWAVADSGIVISNPEITCGPGTCPGGIDNVLATRIFRADGMPIPNYGATITFTATLNDDMFVNPQQQIEFHAWERSNTFGGDNLSITAMISVPRQATSITVLEEGTNEPIPDANVTLTSGDSSVSGKTSDAGLVSFQVPASAENLSVAVTADDYEAGSGTISSGESRTIHLRPIVRTSDILVKVEGEPPPDDNAFVDVEVDLNGTNGYSATGETDADGQFLFEDVPDGPFTVSVTEPPDGYRANSVDGTAPQSEITLQLPRGKTDITVKVEGQDDPGVGLPDVEVHFASEEQSFTATTTEDGTAVFAGVWDGDYTVTVISPPDGYEPGSTTGVAPDDEFVTVILPVSPPSFQPVTIEVRDAATAAPIEGATVTITEQIDADVSILSTLHTDTDHTDATGSVTFTVPVGIERLSAIITADGYQDGSRTFSVGDDVVIVLTLLEEKFATVLVQDASGSPITDAVVALKGGVSVITAADGIAEFSDLAAGTYGVVVTAAGFESSEGELVVNEEGEGSTTITLQKVQEPIPDSEDPPVKPVMKVTQLPATGFGAENPSAIPTLLFAGLSVLSLAAVVIRRQMVRS